jgi:hypothetical protein
MTQHFKKNSFSEPGLHHRVPFFSSVMRYPHIMSVHFEENAPEGNFEKPVLVRFADTYAGAYTCLEC